MREIEGKDIVNMTDEEYKKYMQQKIKQVYTYQKALITFQGERNSISNILGLLSVGRSEMNDYEKNEFILVSSEVID